MASLSSLSLFIFTLSFLSLTHPHLSFSKPFSNPRTAAKLHVGKSLSNAQKLPGKLNRYIKKHHSYLAKPTLQSLQDCQLLSDLNLDYLSTTNSTLNSSDNLGDSDTEEAHTLLSALLTNQQTCIDGLLDKGLSLKSDNEIFGSLVNSSWLYSTSLSLFRRGWSRNNKKGSRNRELVELEVGSGFMVNVNKEVFVTRNKSGDFQTINDAVISAPNNTNAGGGYYLIRVAPGVYEEYVVIPKYKTYIMIVGAGINQTVVTGNRSNADGWTTFNTATFAVVGEGFMAVNITFRNTAGPIKHQAVAVRNGADLSVFYRCSFEGYQDTLYTYSMRQFYKQCDIYGTVDFIFGNAAVVFQDCDIYSRLPLNGQINTITAQGRTDPNQNTGSSLQSCRILAAPDLLASNQSTETYLGRPWKLYSRTVIMESFIDGLINPSGWLAWNGSFALSTLYYAEFNNTGPGSDTGRRVTWPGLKVINASIAVDYTVSSFLSGDSWLPRTEVPYSGGL